LLAPVVNRAKPYKIAPTDKLRISVIQESELDSIVRVDAKGCINLKYVGEVQVVGMIVSDAERALQTAYREGRFLRSPQVTINVEEYAPREVSITGDIAQPGRFTLPVETVSTVLWLITKAGGFKDTAKGTEVKVTRFTINGEVLKIYVVDVESILKGKSKGKKLEDNTLELEPGDVVFVPQRII
jgi:polysaccharide export outer membrane protein